MPSLKDLRSRISSVKATQKITKAMQMVAAAKLRKAQQAAEAARPYAERMETVLTRLATSLAGDPNAPKLLGGTGNDNTHLLVVATGERGLCGAFNSSIARLARDHANRLKREGKTVKILCVGKKGYDILRRQFPDEIQEVVEVKAKQLTFSVAQPIGAKLLDMYDKGEFDVATLFYSRFESVISQKPTALQLIPLPVPENAENADKTTEGRRGLRVRARRGGDPCRTAAAQRAGAGVPRHAGERGLRTGLAHDRDGQCHAQRRRHDQEADDAVQPLPSGADHQGTDRDHLGRRSALTRLKRNDHG